MAKLKDFALYPIAWNLTPEDAVTLIWNGATTTGMPNIRPCAQKATWQYILWWTAGENPPVLRLVRRNSENAEDLFSMPLEGDLLADWRKANGDWRGVGAPRPK